MVALMTWTGVALESLRDRLREERGQTAAEYLGIIVVIAVIIGALYGAGIGDEIATAIKDQVKKIAGGGG